MEQLFLEFGLRDGIFAGMFVWLLIYVLNTSRERENKLYNFLEDMKTEFAKLVGSYERLSNDVAEIREELHNRINKE
jgi:BhlA holin family